MIAFATPRLASAPQRSSGHWIAKLDPPTLITAIYLIGAAITLVWLLAGLIFSRRLRRGATVAPEAVQCELSTIIGSLSSGERAGVRGLVPQLLVSSQIPVASACGLLRPTILLPETALDPKNPSGLRMLLAHEWAHIRRGDLWLLALGRLLLVVLYAHPLFWLLRRRIRIDQELLADAAAAEICGRGRYAENLVAWARRQPPPKWRFANAAGGVGIFERPSQLSRRIAMVLDERIRLSVSCSRRWRASAAALALVAIAALSLVTLRPIPTAKADETAAKQESPDSITISGTVEDENHVSLEGARVRLFLVEWDPKKSQRQLQETHATRNGTFEFAGVDATPLREHDASFHVVAQWPGRATNGDSIVNGRNRPLTLTLVRAGTLEGRIVDTDGKPIAGAVVSASNDPDAVPGICAGVTDTDGKYSIPDLLPFDLADQKPQADGEGRSMVTTSVFGGVGHPDFARQVFRYTKVPGVVDVTLERAAVVAGSVVLTENGQPAAGVKLTFSGDTGEDYWTRTQTDGHGHYRLGMLPPGIYRMYAELAGRPNLFRSDIELKSGENTLDLKFGKGGAIKGRVIDASTGKPIPPPAKERDRVGISTADWHGVLYVGMNQAKVQDDGTFTLLVPSGETYLGVYLGPRWSAYESTPKGVFGGGELEVKEGQTIELELRLTPAKAPATGEWEQNIPIAPPVPPARRPAAPPQPAAPTSKASASARERSGRMPPVQMAAADAATPSESKITLSGVCLDERKKPIADARVRLFRIDYSATPVTFDSERFKFAGSVPGAPEGDRTDWYSVGTGNPGYYDPQSQRVLAEAHGDAEGKFHFDDVLIDKAVLDKRALIQVVAQSPGRATYVADFSWLLTMHFAYSNGDLTKVGNEEKLKALQQGSSSAVELTLPKAVRLHGQILDEDQRPVAGAMVIGPQSLFQPVPGVNSAVSDAQGQYELDDLTPIYSEGMMRMGLFMSLPFGLSIDEVSAVASVRHPKYADQIIAFNELPAEADAALERPAAISGAVTLAENGKPAAARITVQHKSGLTRYAVCDVAGRYQLASLPPGEYRVSAEVPDRPSINQAATLKAGENSLELKLAPGGIIKGRIVSNETGKWPDSAGSFDIGIQVLSTVGEGDAKVASSGFMSVADGTFSFPVHPGRNRLQIFGAKSYYLVDAQRWSKDGIDVAEGQTVEIELRVGPTLMSRLIGWLQSN
jgi:beta-lactamase regulating signal transducer with metallopeptidase domain/protocatechuate 3,4-dioxygenase beta subunit